MLESVLVYGLLTTIMVVCGKIAASREPLYEEYSGLYEKNNHFLQPEIIVIIASFTFVFGCRYGVGVDYFHYLYAYEYDTGERYEFLFKAISDFLRNNSLHFAVFFSVWAFLQITLLSYAFRNYRFILPYLLLYLIIGNFFMSMMNIIRQQIAALIFLCSIQFIDEKKPLKYYLCILLAYFFHRSAVLMVIIYPILRFKDDWFRNVSVQLILLAMAVFLSYRFDLVVQFIETPFVWISSNLGFERYQMAILANETLDNRNQFGANTGYGIYVSLFKCIPIILLCKPMKEYYNSSFFNMLYSMWFVYIFSSFAFGGSITLNRPFVFFTNISIAMAAFFTYYCFKSKEMGKVLLGIAMILVYFMMFLFILSNGELNTSKYTFFWQN